MILSDKQKIFNKQINKNVMKQQILGKESNQIEKEKVKPIKKSK